MTRRPSDRSWALAALSAAYGLAFAWARCVPVHGQRQPLLFDDAMISMRYARHFAQGLGWVWNPGEAPIEGFSDPLWAFGMAALHALGLSGALICGVVLLIGLGFWARTLAELGAWSPRGQAAGPGPLAAAALLLCYPALYWSGSGLEVGLLLYCAWALFRGLEGGASGKALLALSLVALWTRLDSAAFVFPLLAGAWSQAELERRRTLSRVAMMALFAGLVLPTLARRAYFGEWVPNTYFLKVSAAPFVWRLWAGADAFKRFLWVEAPWVALAAVSVWRGRRDAWVRLSLLGFFGLSAYSVWVGGDAWEFLGGPNRYLVPAMPFLFVLAAQALVTLAKPWRWALLVLAILWSNASRGPGAFDQWALRQVPLLPTDQTMAGVGLSLKTEAPGIRLGVMSAGHLCYWSGNPCADLLGKSDAAIAKGPVHPSVLAQGWRALRPGHDKWDYQGLCATPGPLLVLQLPGGEQEAGILKDCGFSPTRSYFGAAYFRR